MLLAAALACLLAIDDGAIRALSPEPVSPWAVTEPTNPTAAYRFTNNGWEDSTTWRIDGEEAKTKFIDRIHPLVWSILVVLLVYGLAILVSDEKQVRRLWPRT